MELINFNYWKIYLLTIIGFIFLYLSFFKIYPYIFKNYVLKLFRKYGLYISFEGKGFIHPFYFKAHNLHVKFQYKKEIDSFEFDCVRIHFKIKFLPLLIGKVKIYDIHFFHPYLFYENKLNSFLKIHLLPDQRRVCFENFNIHKGEVYVIDYLLPGPYKLRLTNIDIKNAKMDLATPVNLLFFIESGKANIDNGTIIAKTKLNEKIPIGSLILKDIKWISVMGINIPFFGTKFDLNVYYSHQSPKYTQIKGYLHLTGNSQENDIGIPFEFTIKWEDYKLPMDLALQKLIENIFATVQPKFIEKGILLIGKEVFDRIKKTPE
ncbi:MAG: hypothetical protein KatS3mg129_0787 [Leptospiraceae bacterium]|nr:MAG: hypothetical protein KatS3mg129_0787 [Leptospiraceae bacterium]